MNVPNSAGGIYIASRASIPARAAQWRYLRDVEGWHIISSWIDEAGEGETDNFSELWVRIENEIRSAERLILYAEPDDFPLKGAYIEVGMALAFGVKVFVVAPGVTIEPRSRRPVGSWMDHPLVTHVPDMMRALDGAARRVLPSDEVDFAEVVRRHMRKDPEIIILGEASPEAVQELQDIIRGNTWANLRLKPGGSNQAAHTLAADGAGSQGNSGLSFLPCGRHDDGGYPRTEAACSQ
ncbi:hypothetical protein KTD31_01380 [Burkholderia multivorans]|uniref:hypothetical protein n=1 Tax=Burkholderia multivorans TaxID=87883 RepID=UPI001C21B736|nr:hypothetical protein [Burkholderia multivorans]MBU9200054.1 hypothetical protein [Burkholderia multivorans]